VVLIRHHIRIAIVIALLTSICPLYPVRYAFSFAEIWLCCGLAWASLLCHRTYLTSVLVLSWKERSSGTRGAG